MKRRRHVTKPPERAANPIIPWLHGLAAMGDERWDEAIVSWQRFQNMSVEPQERWLACQNLAACYLALERHDEALAALDDAERCAPGDPETAYSRGVVYACAGRIVEALAAFEGFARRWPRAARQREVRPTLRRLQRIRQGQAPGGDYLVDHLLELITFNVDLGDLDLVERRARCMIAANPARPEGHFYLGVACVEQGRYREALEAYQSAHALDPRHAETLYNIGYTYQQLDEPAQALPWLERTMRRDPKHRAALYHLGLACERLGRRAEAVAWWRRALQVDPEYYLAQERLHEVGQGPAPAEPPLSPQHQQLRTMAPVVKARMRRPQVYRHGGLTLTVSEEVGFVLEDAENARNGTIHAGGPFQVARIAEEDLLDLIGMIKMLVRQVNVENTRDIAILVYYASRPVFGYHARFDRGQRTEFDADGQFVVTEVPRFFKLRMDSDLSTPYGDPMRGILIYLNQHPEPGILVSTLGLGSP